MTTAPAANKAISTVKATTSPCPVAAALIAACEGVALLASTLRDPGLISTEASRVGRWIDSLAQ